MKNAKKFAECGRILNREMTGLEIVNYLNIKDYTKEKKKAVIQEFKELENKYKSQNVDFSINKDIIGNNVINYKILETRNLLTAFTL